MKIFRYILMASAVVMAVSCSNEEDDIFDKQAAQRMNETVEFVTSTLESSEYGWEVEFYPNHDGQAGGVPMVAIFKNGTVTIYNSDADAGLDAVKSLYQVKGEQECLLSFDSYNKVFHYYSEPLGSNAPYGMESDYEFAYKSISEDGNTITFKGKRYAQPFVLKRMTGDMTPEQYVQKINTLKDKVFRTPRGLVDINGEQYDVNFYDGVFSYTEKITEIEDGEEVTRNVTRQYAAIMTLDGVHFQKPLEFKGVTFQDLIYDEASDELKTSDGNVVFPFALPRGYRTYEELAGAYTMIDSDGEAHNLQVRATGDGRTYTISGMTYASGTVKAVYTKAFGSLEIHAQYIGRYSTYYSWLMANTNDGYITWSPNAAIVGRNNEAGDIIFDGSGTYISMTEYAVETENISGGGDDLAGYLTRYPEGMMFTRK